MTTLRSTLSTQTGRYIVVGIVVYIFEVAVLLGAGILGASPFWSVTLSFWLGLVTSFFLQKLITFKDKRLHKKIVALQFLAACILVLWNYGVTILLTKLLENVLPAVFTRTLALGITTIWNFYIYKTRIFKDTGIDTLVS